MQDLGGTDIHVIVLGWRWTLKYFKRQTGSAFSNASTNPTPLVPSPRQRSAGRWLGRGVLAHSHCDLKSSRKAKWKGSRCRKMQDRTPPRETSKPCPKRSGEIFQTSFHPVDWRRLAFCILFFGFKPGQNANPPSQLQPLDLFREPEGSENRRRTRVRDLSAQDPH